MNTIVIVVIGLVLFGLLNWAIDADRANAVNSPYYDPKKIKSPKKVNKKNKPARDVEV